MKNYNENGNQKKKFTLFNMNKDGKGVYEVEDRKPTLGFFFKLLFRKFSSILQLNILMLIHIIPIFAAVFVFFSGDKTPTITNVLYPALYGINKIAPTGSVPLLDVSGVNMGIPVFSSTTIIIFLCVALVWIITFGWQNVGSAYVLRGLFRGDPIFVFSDFFYGIKKNFKQGLLMGLLDSLIIIVLLVDISFFMSNTANTMLSIMYFVIIALIFLYFIMRFYIYQLLITFDLTISKIIKNSLIFIVLGIKRNLLAFLGIVLLVALNVILIVWLMPIGIAIPLVLPLVYLAGTVGFITVYAAYPVIDKYMIEPYVNDSDDEE